MDRFIAFVGPDGAGKSTMIEKLGKGFHVAPRMTKVRVPGWLKERLIGMERVLRATFLRYILREGIMDRCYIDAIVYKRWLGRRARVVRVFKPDVVIFLKPEKIVKKELDDEVVEILMVWYHKVLKEEGYAFVRMFHYGLGYAEIWIPKVEYSKHGYWSYFRVEKWVKKLKE